MRLASLRALSSLLGLGAVSLLLVGCPEKGGAPADNKTSAEPERQEPDDEGRAADTKKAAPAAAEEKKPDDGKDEGGW